MNKIKDTYYYLFYKLYRFFETVSFDRWLSEWKAALFICALELFVISSIIYYLNIPLGDGTYFYLFSTVVIIIPNYLVFLHKNQWKGIIKQFDKWPKKRNKVGGAIVLSIVLIIIFNLIFSVNYMFQQAKRNQTGPYSKEYLESKKVK